MNVHVAEGMRWGFVGRDGKMVIRAHFVSALASSEGLAAVQLIDGKWGYLNSKGTMAITPQFDTALPFYNGMAQVSAGSTSGYIDPPGSPVPRSGPRPASGPPKLIKEIPAFPPPRF